MAGIRLVMTTGRTRWLEAYVLRSGATAMAEVAGVRMVAVVAKWKDMLCLLFVFQSLF